MTFSRRVLALVLGCALAVSAAFADVRRANFGNEKPARETRQVADWVVDSNDAKGLPFVVIDKVQARLYVFEPGGVLRGAAPVLLGLAKGDHTVPGIGERELRDIRPEERTTPAGRFVAEHGRNHKGDDILWVDYDSAVSMHRVRSVGPGERRLERLASATPADNRISYGCINVPAAFYDQVLLPTVGKGNAIVYVLPEVRPLREVFNLYDVAQRARTAGVGANPTL